jgi:hypothetical protein
MHVCILFTKAFESTVCAKPFHIYALGPRNRREVVRTGKCQFPRAQPELTKLFIGGILAVSSDLC